MSYYHKLFHDFDICYVHVVITEAANIRRFSVKTTKKFSSMTEAVSYISDEEIDLNNISVSAHLPNDTITVSQEELSSIVSLYKAIRDCQD